MKLFRLSRWFWKGITIFKWVMWTDESMIVVLPMCFQFTMTNFQRGIHVWRESHFIFRHCISRRQLDGGRMPQTTGWRSNIITSEVIWGSNAPNHTIRIIRQQLWIDSLYREPRETFQLASIKRWSLAYRGNRSLLKMRDFTTRPDNIFQLKNIYQLNLKIFLTSENYRQVSFSFLSGGYS